MQFPIEQELQFQERGQGRPPIRQFLLDTNHLLGAQHLGFVPMHWLWKLESIDIQRIIHYTNSAAPVLPEQVHHLWEAHLMGNMNIHLREGEMEAFLRQGLVNPFVHAEKHRPVICRLHPNPDSKIHGTRIEINNLHKRQRILQNALILLAEPQQDRLGLVVIVTVRDGKRPIHAARILFGKDGHDASRQDAVGNMDNFVVSSQNDGVEDLYLFHHAFLALGWDEITHLERAEQDDDHASGEILQRAAQGHTDGQSRRSQQSN